MDFLKWHLLLQEKGGLEKGQAGGRMSGEGEGWRVGGEFWQETCLETVVLHSDLVAEPQQNETPDQTKILKFLTP